GGDWLWTVGGFAAVGVLGGGIGITPRRLPPGARGRPLFMGFETPGPGPVLDPGAEVPVFWPNILWGEFVWVGVGLPRQGGGVGVPRQEVAFGGSAWLVNGILWLLFHAAFPWPVLLTLAPITLILPYIVQRRRSTWAGVVIHAGFGGMGFLALAFGLV